MKKLFVYLIVFLLPLQIIGQNNLVPNSGFEQFTSCPNSSSQIYLAFPWEDANGNSTDFYHACSANTPVPFIFPNYLQYSHTGNGMAAIWTYQMNYREYLQVQLNQTLEAGKYYQVEFYLVLAHGMGVSINNIGAFISSVPPSQSFQGEVISWVTPQIILSNNPIISDSINWTRITACYTASGGEQYLTIGNFRDDLNTDTMHLAGSYPGTYSFIDDVSVVEIETPFAGFDSQICPADSVSLGTFPNSNCVYSWQPTSGLSDSTISNPFASPSVTTTYTLTQTQCNVTQTASVTVTVLTDCNPSIPFFIPSIIKGDEMLNIPGLEAGSRITVFDAMGKRVFISENYRNEFGAHLVAPGTYIVQLERVDGEIVKQKLVVVK